MGNIELKQNAVIDHETVSAYTFDVVVTDHLGLTATMPVTIGVIDENEPPVFTDCNCAHPSGVAFTLPENVGGGYTVGNLHATDPESDAIMYTITEDDSNLFLINENGEIQTKAGAVFDYESVVSYTLSMTAKESGRPDGDGTGE